MEILWWLVLPVVVTVLAMIWASWAGRPQREETDRSEVAYERFAQAIAKEHPGARRARPAIVRDRSTGIAVRPSRGGPTARPMTRPMTRPAARPGANTTTRRHA